MCHGEMKLVSTTAVAAATDDDDDDDDDSDGDDNNGDRLCSNIALGYGMERDDAAAEGRV